MTIVIDSPQHWTRYIEHVRAVCARCGFQAKRKTFHRLVAGAHGYPHENAVYQNLPVAVQLDEVAAERLVLLMAVHTQQVLTIEQARDALQEAAAAAQNP